MSVDYKILIIDDNIEQGKQLQIILNFLGETCQQLSYADWEANVDDTSHYLTILLGDCADISAYVKKIKDIYDWAPHHPLITVGDKHVDETLPSDVQNMVLDNFTFPVTYHQVMDTLHRCHATREHNPLRRKPGGDQPVPLFRSMVGNSKEIQSVRQLIDQVAPSDVTVLILGESGTGKEVAARNIHNKSHRRDKPFVPINCGAIPAELLESELFGHEKGAFTGAISARQGRFELAHGGTLFLDEIGDMPLAMQVKLLRVLQEQTFERVGSNKTIHADVRIIAATHRNLEEHIAKGNFREDLFYRLNVFPIRMPAMRDRSDDIPLLINELVTKIEGQKRGSVRLLPRAVEALRCYPWLGNVRELANLIERLAILYPNGIVDVDDLPKRFIKDREETDLAALDTHSDKTLFSLQTTVSPLPNEGFDLKAHLVKTELALITQALEESDWVVARAASNLNMRRTTLVEKMRKYQLARPGSEVELEEKAE